MPKSKVFTPGEGGGGAFSQQGRIQEMLKEGVGSKMVHNMQSFSHSL